MKRILVIGANGQLGFELQRSLAPLGRITALDRLGCDLGEANTIRRVIRDIRPDIVVNAGAYTAVDKAEVEYDTAWAINARAPGVIGEEAVAIGATVVHFSTDYVFDGLKSGWYNECDVPAPCSAYGRTKLEGEYALVNTGAKHFVFRTSWVVGVHGGNFAKTMLRLAAQRETLSVVADQYGAPTSAALLADITAQVLAQVRAHEVGRVQWGTYHVAAGGETTWFNYARYVITKALAAGMELKLKPESILPITTSEYPTPAKRPANSRLDTEKIKKTFELSLPDWQDGIDHILHQIIQKR